MVVFRLLARCQRLVEHFQFHCLNDIFALTKPEDQLIALLHTACCQTDPVIQIGKLIRPLFPVVPLFQLLEHADALLKPYILRLVQLILENVTSGVLRGDLHKLLVIIDRLYIFLCLDAQFAERIADRFAAGSSLICQQQHVLCVLIAPVDLIQIADGTEHHHALYSAPVNRIRNICRLRIISCCYQFLYFIRSYFIFKLIQGISLPIRCVSIVTHYYCLVYHRGKHLSKRKAKKSTRYSGHILCFLTTYRITLFQSLLPEPSSFCG